MEDQELRIYSPSGILGYGYQEDSFQRAMEKNPHLIACDGGSTDPGPNYLGMGEAFVGRDAAKRDLKNMLIAGHDRKIPVIVGTSGGAGGDPHIQWMREILEEIATENDLHFKIALIHSEQSKDYVADKLEEGKIKPLWPMGALTRDPEQEHPDSGNGRRGALHRGPEPGSAGDPCGALRRCGHLRGPAHKGRVRPGAGLGGRQASGVRRRLHRAPLEIRQRGADSINKGGPRIGGSAPPGLQCTPLSVGSFFLHENETPLYHTEPSGILDTSQLQFEAVDERTVKITGARFVPSGKYTVRMEGVEFLGYRCICVSTTRDPVLVQCIDSYIDSVRSIARQRVEGLGIGEDEYKLLYRVIGKDSVMGSREPVKELSTHELGIIIEAVAPTQDMANEIVGIARQGAKNGHYEGKLCDEGCITLIPS